METETQKTAKRPPVVAILGHIDHGKSTLLDYIRKSNVVAKEAGGITQHISTYEITHKDEEHGEQKITFIDTPGHEAFCDVRSRGAGIADIAILIVSAEDGVMPQTVEAINCIKNDNVPFIVAINKMDSPRADIDRTKSALVENEVYIEGYGGDIPVVPISAKTGEGVNELLSMILLVAEIEELKMDVTKKASGIVVEANKDEKRGISATVIIKDGSLKIGDFVAGHTSMSPVRSLEDTSGNKFKEVQASLPIVIYGWTSLPPVGSIVEAFETKKEAEDYCKNCSAQTVDVPQEKNIQSKADLAVIPIIIKTDVSGTGEAIKFELNKIETERVKFHILENTTGVIGESDMKKALSDAQTIVVGMGVGIDPRAEALRERNGTIVMTFKIIYELVDWLKKVINERTPKVMVEEIVGDVKVLAIFNQTKKNQVLGGKVTTGVISLGNTVNILRRGEKIGSGIIKELQQQRVATKQVQEGNEFGTSIASETEIAQGDTLEVITKIEK
ncbi:MAG: translation initiation factor IF-2 [Candidatus Paceibacterota bacterium]